MAQNFFSVDAFQAHDKRRRATMASGRGGAGGAGGAAGKASPQARDLSWGIEGEPYSRLNYVDLIDEIKEKSPYYNQIATERAALCGDIQRFGEFVLAAKLATVNDAIRLEAAVRAALDHIGCHLLKRVGRDDVVEAAGHLAGEQARGDLPALHDARDPTPRVHADGPLRGAVQGATALDRPRHLRRRSAERRLQP